MRATEVLHYVNAPKNRARPLAMVPVRVFREAEAGAYVGFSDEHLRKLRYADQARLEEGEEPEGPKWVELERGQRKAVRYLREDLDSWVDSWRVDTSMGFPKVS